MRGMHCYGTNACCEVVPDGIRRTEGQYRFVVWAYTIAEAALSLERYGIKFVDLEDAKKRIFATANMQARAMPRRDGAVYVSSMDAAPDWVFVPMAEIVLAGGAE
jgi:hypothetical protein